MKDASRHYPKRTSQLIPPLLWYLKCAIRPGGTSFATMRSLDDAVYSLHFNYKRKTLGPHCSSTLWANHG
ncbi:hypothetical protein Mapa_013714 [Marchantia paleacea]|nr:hypothetical protein Mapa_013714 [Marchantia paleacea]